MKNITFYTIFIQVSWYFKILALDGWNLLELRFPILPLLSMYSNFFLLESYFYPMCCCFRLLFHGLLDLIGTVYWYWVLHPPFLILQQFNEICSFLLLYWVQWNVYIKRYRSGTWLVPGWNPHPDVRFANHVPYLRLRSWNQRPALHRPLLPDTNAKNRPMAIKTRCACAHRLWLDWFPSVNIRRLVFLPFHARAAARRDHVNVTFAPVEKSEPINKDPESRQNFLSVPQVVPMK